jgi:Rieske Fe-S protein
MTSKNAQTEARAVEVHQPAPEARANPAPAWGGFSIVEVESIPTPSRSGANGGATSKYPWADFPLSPEGGPYKEVIVPTDKPKYVQKSAYSFIKRLKAGGETELPKFTFRTVKADGTATGIAIVRVK